MPIIYRYNIRIDKIKIIRIDISLIFFARSKYIVTQINVLINIIIATIVVITNNIFMHLNFQQ